MSKTEVSLAADAGTTRVAKSSARDHVMSVIREGVRRGVYAPGARVIEAELQRSLGVSRGTVREALSRLAAEGVVDLHRFKGATVCALTMDDVEDILDMREVLEGLVARKAAARIAGGAPGRSVAQAQAELDAALAPDQPAEAYLRANTQYHAALVEAAGSARLSAQVDQLSTAFVRVATAGWLPASSFAGSNQDHQAITAAVLAGDAAAAELLMRAHIRRTAYVLSALGQSQALI